MQETHPLPYGARSAEEMQRNLARLGTRWQENTTPEPRPWLPLARAHYAEETPSQEFIWQRVLFVHWIARWIISAGCMVMSGMGAPPVWPMLGR
jgi:hypothetical protein